MARTGASKAEIRGEIAGRFGYNLERTLSEIRPVYILGGDSDTMACIAGAVGEAFYGGVPVEIQEKVRACLPEEFLVVVDAFRLRYGLP
jgi:hypothetical protein